MSLSWATSLVEVKEEVKSQRLKFILRGPTIPLFVIVMLTFLLAACEEVGLNIVQPQSEGQSGGPPVFDGRNLFRPPWCPIHSSDEWVMSKLPDRELLVVACEKPGDDFFKPRTFYLGYWKIPGCTYDLGLLEEPESEGYVLLGDEERPDTNYFTKCVKEERQESRLNFP